MALQVDISPFTRRTDRDRNLKEEVLVFESDGARLFGLFHLPLMVPHALRRAGLVLCSPFAVEQVGASLLQVEAARALAARGLSIFRFHYRGTGDSDGDSEDVTLSGQVADTLRAIDLLCKRERLERIGLLGIRLGGTVAALAAEVEPRVQALILWEPLVRPRAYFSEFLRAKIFSELMNHRQPSASVNQMLEEMRRTGQAEALGYLLYRRLFDDAAPVDLARDLTTFSGRALVVQISRKAKVQSEFQMLRQRLEACGARCDLEVVTEEPGWFFGVDTPYRSERLIWLTWNWCRQYLL